MKIMITSIHFQFFFYSDLKNIVYSFGVWRKLILYNYLKNKQKIKIKKLLIYIYI